MPAVERSVKWLRRFYRVTLANGIFILAQILFSYS